MQKRIFLAIGLIFISLSLQIVNAQYGSSEWGTAILEGLLGRLPNPCYPDIGTPTCMQCVASTKILSLMFFIGIFYLVFYLVLRNVVEKVEQPVETIGTIATHRPMNRTETRIIAMISLALALVILHSDVMQSISTVVFWAGIVLGILVALTIVSSAKGMSLIPFAVITIFILIGVVMFIWPQLQGVLSQLESACT
jgi:hypothetical protein